MKDNIWKFEGTSWEFIQLVRHACVVYECVKTKRNDVMQILTDDKAFQEAADEYGITYEAVKDTMRHNLDLADHLDGILNSSSTQIENITIADNNLNYRDY